MRTIAQAIQAHEVNSIDSTETTQTLNIDVERNLLTMLDALASNLEVPKNASDIEARLLIAEHIKADLMESQA